MLSTMNRCNADKVNIAFVVVVACLLPLLRARLLFSDSKKASTRENAVVVALENISNEGDDLVCRG